MPDAQFGDLAGATRCRILMAFATGLGVIERSKPVSYSLNFVEFHLIRLVRQIIHHAVTFVVEASRRIRNLRGGGSQRKTQESHSNEEPHGFSLLEWD
jgi:hypothetical protein